MEVAPLRLSVKWGGVLQLGCLTVDAQMGEMSKADSGESASGKKRTMKTHGVFEVISQHSQPFQRGAQSFDGQADNIAVAAVDALDDAFAEFLDGVRAGFVERVDLGEVIGDVGG